jgi:DNA-binding transcriptional regulator YhcF (GntR family)
MQPEIETNSTRSSSDQIEQFYAREILTGRLAGGHRLPPNEVLARNWKTSVRSVHKALSSLVAQGLLDRKQRRGTFVRDQSHNSVIGVLVSASLVSECSPYFRWLCHELEKEIESCRLACRIYDNLLEEATMDPLKSRSIKHFLLDRSVYDFKGFVYLGTATMGKVQGLDDLKPRVVHLDSKRGLDVIIDMEHFQQTTVRELAKRGFRRMAYIRPLWETNTSVKPVDLKAAFTQPAEELDIPTPQVLDLELSDQSYGMEQEAFEIFVRILKGHRLGKGALFPEVLIVPDDIIVRPLIAALQSVGLRIPEDVGIAILSNAEVRLFYGVLVYRYEMALSEMAKRMIEVLKTRISRGSEPVLPYRIRGNFLELS